MDSIHSLVRTQQDNFLTGETAISKYVNWSLHETLEKIDAYANSKHISGDTDAMGRDKPFFNICSSAINIWYRATDIDRSNIKLKASNTKSMLPTFALNIHLQEWMKREKFGVFLNEWGRTLGKYGSAVVKFVEKSDGLHPGVVSWNRLIVDSVDFENNPIIEKIYVTPGQLQAMPGYDKKVVKALMEARTTRQTQDKQNIDTKNDFIELYEVHGLLPLSYLTGKGTDENDYVQQMHVVSFMSNGEGEYDDFTLVSGKEKKNPYMLTHLIKEDGRVLGIGAVENLFESQWMVNHSMKAIKDQLDLASQLIYQTSDPSFVGQNVLEAIQTGDILIHSANQPLTQLANNSHDITSLQNYAGQWQTLAQEITSTPDSMRGITPPSGTALGTVQIATAQGLSLFELMTENKGLAIEEMMREYVIPYLKKKIDDVRELSATLSENDIMKLDSMYIKSETNRITNELNKKTILSGKIAEGVDTEAIQKGVMENLEAQGDQRFIVPSEIESVTWSDALKDIEYTIEVEVTGEAQDKATIMTTLTNVMQTIAGNPNILQDSTARTLFNKILEQTGVMSPVELIRSPIQPQQTQQPAQAAPAMPIGRT